MPYYKCGVCGDRHFVREELEEEQAPVCAGCAGCENNGGNYEGE